MSRFKYMGIASKWRFFLFVVLMVEYLPAESRYDLEFKIQQSRSDILSH